MTQKREQRTTEKLVELKKLAGQANENVRRRIQLAIEVLADKEWITTVHKGSLDAAEKALKDEYFRDLSGYVSLGTLMDMYKKVPETTWKEYRYDLRAIQLIFEEKDKPKSRNTTSWKPLYEKLLEELEELKRQVAYWQNLAEERGQTVETQRTKIAELTVTIAALKGREAA